MYKMGAKQQLLKTKNAAFVDADSLRSELLRYEKKELVEMIIKQKAAQGIKIPLYILCSENSPLESVVKYLKEKEGLSIKDIAYILKRNVQTIWTTYRNSNQAKHQAKNQTEHLAEHRPNTQVQKDDEIPVSILSKEEGVSIMEAAVSYLKQDKGLRLIEIAKMLGRNQKTVWTCYNRYIKKMEEKK
jgi:DNA-binding CsgD family transcriptional regulator